MAVPSVIEGRFVVISAGDGAGPEVFTPLCGLFVTAFNRTVNSQDRALRDCTNPTEIPWRVTIVNSKQFDITLGGVYNLDNRATIDALWGEKVNYRLTIFEDDGITDVGYWEGNFTATAVNSGAPETDLTSLEITLASNGPVLWVDAT
ncbi:MAG TPA: hypothetical protein VKB96_10990 [Gammaproteobacteria bacterium]|nr:hypothetical protein [Gammaproteobacteria bacterium]